jgi:hypothetical protein
MKRRIFTYWVSPPEGTFPYIQLCIQTWHTHIPNLELIVLDHGNIRNYIDDERFDFEKFTLLSLPHQSDIAQWIILAKYGGVFMDADTIVFKNIFEEFDKFNPKKLTLFGYPNTLGVHVAVMSSPQPGNKFISAAADIALQRLNALSIENIRAYDIGSQKSPFIWSHFANEIIQLVGEDENFKGYLKVLDRTKSGNILESRFLGELPNTLEQYLKFYFSTGAFSIDDVIKKIEFGAVSLHNSWTPPEYKKLSFEHIMVDKRLLSELLKYALFGNLKNA